MIGILLVACVLGQADPLPSDPAAQRQWLLAHLIVDMGQYDSEKYQKLEKMIMNQSDQQIGILVHYYQARKAQVNDYQNAQAIANLERLRAYRDHLQRELDYKMQVRQEEQRITNWGSAMAMQQFYNSYNYGPFAGGYGYGPYYGYSPGFYYAPRIYYPHPPIQYRAPTYHSNYNYYHRYHR